MRAAAHKGNGGATAAPDVCNTPSASGTAPVTYTNDAQNTQATGFSEKVLICSNNAMHLATKISSSSGDEAGTAHYSMKGQLSYTTGSGTVYIEGKNGISLGDPTTQNAANAVGSHVTPSSSTVTYSRRLSSRTACRTAPAGADQTLSHRDTACLLAELASPPLSLPGKTRGGRWMRLGHFERNHIGPLHVRLGHFGMSHFELGHFGLDRVGLGHFGLGHFGLGHFGLGHVRLCHFGVELAGELAALLRNDPHAPLLLDLRGNPGGRLDVALVALGLFLGPGHDACVVSGEGQVRALPTVGEKLHHGPVAVWSDALTASAAELFGELLVRTGRAVSVTPMGLAGYGKRTLQTLEPTEGGAALRTFGRWRLCGDADMATSLYSP